MNTKDTIKVVKESLQDSIYEKNKIMMRQLDKIGDKNSKCSRRFSKETIIKR